MPFDEDDEIDVPVIPDEEDEEDEEDPLTAGFTEVDEDGIKVPDPLADEEEDEAV